ncbi:nitrate- and nitrite sensing domain-containing protein [Marinobacterium aestuariivivens]|uniref:Nitrate- and nitrite sensing domain-containing protein n=1 Tax=Marinobacterium aestuariivivens TaxID=1698799 RepID=A0ABW1ZY67_9GAMM
MHGHLRTAEDFFLASRRSEIASLRQLTASCELVTRVSALIHELQRERGLSNVYLKSRGARFRQQRAGQIDACVRAEAQLRQGLQTLDFDDSPAAARARLFNTIAYCLHGLDALPGLRTEVDRLALSATDSTLAMGRLIAGLLSLIFETADLSDDPQITRALVVKFNFLQGKEYAGQERAWAAIGFAAGEFTEIQLDHLAGLVELQGGSFRVFEELSEPEPIRLWRETEHAENTRELDRLRRVISRTEARQPVPSALSEVWYELATARIDSMQRIEELLSASLLRLCQRRLSLAEAELARHQDCLQQLASLAAPAGTPLIRRPGREGAHLRTPDDAAAIQAHYSRELVRSLHDLVEQQSERLDRLGDELTEARQSLSERKLIERAKGLLMQHQGLDEEQAYRTLQLTSMRLNRRLAEVAESLIGNATQLNITAADGNLTTD